MKHAAVGVGKLIAAAGIALAAILAIAAMYVFGFGLFAQGTADFRGETQKREQVEGSGALRVAAYNHFFDLCASVQSNEASIRNLTNELGQPPYPSTQRETVIRSSISALQNQRAASINQYNADARKDYTIGQFRDSGLPFQLDIDAKETKCVV